jgi:hypothetical protein
MGDLCIYFKSHKYLEKPYKIIDEQDDWYYYELYVQTIELNTKFDKLDTEAYEKITSDEELQAFDVIWYLKDNGSDCWYCK